LPKRSSQNSFLFRVNSAILAKRESPRNNPFYSFSFVDLKACHRLDSKSNSILCFGCVELANVSLCNFENFFVLGVLLFVQPFDSFASLNKSEESSDAWLAFRVRLFENSGVGEVFSCIDKVSQSVRSVSRVQNLSIPQIYMEVLGLSGEDLFVAVESFGVVLLAEVDIGELLPRLEVFLVRFDVLVQNLDCATKHVHVSEEAN